MAESSFVDHSSTVVHSTLVANSGMRYDTSRVVLESPVVLEFAFFAVVGRCSGPPFLHLRRSILVVRNLGSD